MELCYHYYLQEPADIIQVLPTLSDFSELLLWKILEPVAEVELCMHHAYFLSSPVRKKYLVVIYHQMFVGHFAEDTAEISRYR